MSPDHINAFFEFIGGCLLWINVYKLYQDKELKGVYWPTTAFFFLWGMWNIFYYPHLNQWWSFAGGVWLVLANFVWVVLALYYNKIDKRSSLDKRLDRSFKKLKVTAGV